MNWPRPRCGRWRCGRSAPPRPPAPPGRPRSRRRGGSRRPSPRGPRPRRSPGPGLADLDAARAHVLDRRREDLHAPAAAADAIPQPPSGRGRSPRSGSSSRPPSRSRRAPAARPGSTRSPPRQVPRGVAERNPSKAMSVTGRPASISPSMRRRHGTTGAIASAAARSSPGREWQRTAPAFRSRYQAPGRSSPS